ncbi:hypothetical protein [Quisquiliibacterium transsilvanicum]|uniref:Uncharacterized protein n=1 Tax=Quisquiliibacterium transsilvanicum TaxID=1549638 RepID=A0A7W8HGQ0_9BURK|nr:hypothetical protein [Quisquiliibacterium transsilvanicum]MBB5271537.1 hypothetical protein [Quisquiliibacterium transsilvanicum]
MRKQCRRKVWALVNPIQHAIEGAAITPDEKLNQLKLRELAAIEAFAKGKATVREWQDIVHMANLCELMAANGVGPEAARDCAALQAHMVEAAKRYERTKKMGATGEGLQAMRSVFEYHHLQRTSISRGEYERFIGELKNRVKSKAPEVVVI